MRKILFILGSLFFSVIGYSQDFGLLFKTTLRPSNSLPELGHSGGHDYNTSLYKNNVSALLGSKSFITNRSITTSTNYELYKFSNPSFDRIELSFSGSIVSLKDASNGCNKSDNFELNNDDFIVGNRIFFSGCIGSTEVLTMYTEQPSDNSICYTQNITLKYGYDWQYKLINGNWENFPASYQGKRIIEFL